MGLANMILKPLVYGSLSTSEMLGPKDPHSWIVEASCTGKLGRSWGRGPSGPIRLRVKLQHLNWMLVQRLVECCRIGVVP